MNSSKKICVIIPVHNGEKWLPNAIRSLNELLPLLSMDYEIIIAEDGSTDGSYKLAKSLESSRVHILHSDKRLGKGKAIARAVASTAADIVLFMDVDMASDPSQAGLLMAAIENGADIAIGSRLLPGSRLHIRSMLRSMMSKAYNALIRLLFRTGVSDHQCGFKAFRSSTVSKLLSSVSDGGWFWDTELIVRAKKVGLEVKEVPIKWTESEESVFSLVFDVPVMALSALRLWFKVRGMGSNDNGPGL